MNHRDELYKLVEAYCISQKWKYDAIRDKYVIHFAMGLKCRLQVVRVWVEVKDTCIAVYAVSPLRADAECRPRAAEFITRVNSGLLLGNFDMNYATGEIRYRSVLSAKSTLPHMDDVERTVDMAFLMMDKYGNGLYKLMKGSGSPETLVRECEA